MSVAIEPNNLGDLLKYETNNLYSREAVDVASGQNLKLGTIVGRVTETGLVKQFDPPATDGTEGIIGVLLEDCDASSGSKSPNAHSGGDTCRSCSDLVKPNTKSKKQLLSLN